MEPYHEERDHRGEVFTEWESKGFEGRKKFWRKEVHAEGGGDNDGRSEEEGGERQRVFD